MVDPQRDFAREGEEHVLKTGPYIVLDGPNRAYIAMKSRSEERPIVQWWVASAHAEQQEVLDTLENEDAGDGDNDGSAQLGHTDGPPADAKTHSVVTTRDADLLIAQLDGLPAGEPIAYRVKVGELYTKTFTFRTGVPRGQPFRFVVYGDTRSRSIVHAAVVDAVAREDVAFLIHTGDMVQRGGVKQQWDRFFQIERPLLVDTPVFPSIGNHDLGFRDYYERYFMLERTTSGRRYYSADYGDLRIIALDGEIEGRRGSRQFQYAERALLEAAERDMLTILFLHWPPYSSGKHGSQLGVRAPISALAKDYGVELVVTGHDHIYERTVPIEGTTYVVSGSAGAPTRNVDPQWFTAHSRTEPHYVLVDVTPETLTLRAVNLDGDVFDTSVIPKNAPGDTAIRRSVRR